jgi:four helix bundle protein
MLLLNLWLTYISRECKMTAITKFEDLIAWQEARKLVQMVYKLTSDGAFSKDFGLKDQMQRAAVSIMAKVKPGREAALREYGNTIEKAVAANPEVLAPLKLHYLRWILFEIKGDTYFMYQGIFDTDFDKYIEDAVALFTSTGVTTVFTNLEGFPENWQGNVPVWNKFFRDHQCPSFLEYAEYPYATADEIKKALRVKSAMSTMLDQMQ